MGVFMRGVLRLDRPMVASPARAIFVPLPGWRLVTRGNCTMRPMANIASLLKSEISRVARKEVRAETAALKKAVSSYRSEIAALKRRAQALESDLRRLSKAAGKAAGQAAASDDDAPLRAQRFSAKGLASQRKRLGLSAHECGLLVGASGQ